MDWRHYLARQISSMGDFSERVIEAFTKVPRELFSEYCYPPEIVYSDDVIVTSKDGSEYTTSSQPSLMALFMASVDLKEGFKVLEIGSGTGYNACVMAHVVGESGFVVGIEFNEHFFEKAVEAVSKLGLENVLFVNGDGYYGFEKFAPYDAVVVTVAVERISPHWVDQIKIGGKIVAPIHMYTVERQPAFVFEKTPESLIARHLVETRFIKAKGLLGNLNEINLHKLIEIEDKFTETSGFLEIRSSQYETISVFHLASWSLCEKNNCIYFVEEEGFARWKNGWEMFGRPQLVKDIAKRWSRTHFVPMTLLNFIYDHGMNFKGLERWDEL